MPHKHLLFQAAAREKVGKVKVDAIVDEHFAQATVVDGKVEKGDIARLADPGDSMNN